MFFSHFPDLIYNDIFMKDISKAIVSKEIDNPRFLYDTYHIKNGERPDSVSNKFYNVPYYHWVLLVTNNMTLREWPKTEKVFEKFLKGKYGKNIDAVHHYANEEGIIYSYKSPITIVNENNEELNFFFNGDGLGAEKDGFIYLLGDPVSNRVYEETKNEMRKNIRILNKEFIPEVIELAKTLLK